MAFLIKKRIQRLTTIRWGALATRLVFVATAFSLTACTGMYMGLSADDERADRLLSEDEIKAYADIYRITPEAVQRLQSEEQADGDIKQARREASKLTPNSTDYIYTVAPRDVLQVTVWNHPELNNPAGQITNETAGRTVGPDGYIFYPYVGRVKVAGRTTQDIRQELANRLAAYLTEPQVDVSVLRYNARKAFVVGQVTKPGPIPITNEPLYVTTLLTEAGGFDDTADLSRVVLNRNGVLHNLNLYALYYQGDLSQNMLLQDGDILNVPERTQDKVFVLGEVAEPQAQIMPWGRYTLADALGDAGGLDPVTSRASQVYVLRAVDSSRPQIWHLNASSPTALILAEGFPLKPRDVVFVDAAAVTRWSRVINQILPTASSLMTGSRTFR